jgi:hypothetical protein
MVDPPIEEVIGTPSGTARAAALQTKIQNLRGVTPTGKDAWLLFGCLRNDGYFRSDVFEAEGPRPQPILRSPAVKLPGLRINDEFFGRIDFSPHEVRVLDEIVLRESLDRPDPASLPDGPEPCIRAMRQALRKSDWKMLKAEMLSYQALHEDKEPTQREEAAEVDEGACHLGEVVKFLLAELTRAGHRYTWGVRGITDRALAAEIINRCFDRLLEQPLKQINSIRKLVVVWFRLLREESDGNDEDFKNGP